MARDLKSAAIAVIVLTLVFGLAIPAIVTGFAQVAFADKADGSLLKVNGKVVGSRLAAQSFTKPAVLPSATFGDRACVQRGRNDLRQPRADEPRPRQERSAAGRERS